MCGGGRAESEDGPLEEGKSKLKITRAQELDKLRTVEGGGSAMG